MEDALIRGLLKTTLPQNTFVYCAVDAGNVSQVGEGVMVSVTADSAVNANLSVNPIVTACLNSLVESQGVSVPRGGGVILSQAQYGAIVASSAAVSTVIRGIKSSEFYVSAGTIVLLSFNNLAGLHFQLSGLNAIVAGSVAGVYTVCRTLVKK